MRHIHKGDALSEIDAEFLKQLQEAFVIEAREQLQTIMTNVINMESSKVDEEKHTQSENILHELHSLKGNSRAAGVTPAETICQLMESAIFSMRRKKELLKPEAADVFHKAIDSLDEIINKVEEGQAEFQPADLNETLHRLKMLDERQRLRMEAGQAGTGEVSTQGADPTQAAGASPASLAPGAGQAGPATGAVPGAGQAASPSPAGSAGAASPGTSSVSPAGPAPGSGPAGSQGAAGPQAGATGSQPPGTSPGAAPASAAASPGSTSTAASPTHSTQAPSGSTPPPVALQRHDDVPTPRAEPTAQASAATAVKSGTGMDKAAASTRIALWKLDKLLRESEEMLVLKQVSEQHLDDLRDLKLLSKNLSSEAKKLSDSIKEQREKREDLNIEKTLSMLMDTLAGISNSIDLSLTTKMRRQNTEQRLCFNMVDGFIDSVKSLLMQDFTSLLSIVPKVVRDLSRELHKEIELEIFGTEIEIDRRILEEIKDPVIHLVRNSLDHGIETAEQRIAVGKPGKASLKIGARQDESGYVQLIIQDDGRGINAEKLKAAAVKEGAISAEEAASMSEYEAIELMYRSAVSTSEKLTEISGRGLGMAIVRERLHELGGRVIVETKLGKGTKFILQLPTKLSTFRGIQVMSGKQSFIIPTLHVHYAGRVQRSEIRQKGSRNVAMVNGQLTSVQSMADVLNIPRTHDFKSKAARSYQQILVLETGDRRAGFLVDEILHEHEVLVRGLSYPLVRVANISGATILGSGQVVPVLNIADLLESAGKHSKADELLTKELSYDVERAQRQTERPVFLVDRHATSLIMLKSLLESEGYLVRTFESNENALEGLDEEEPLIVLKSNELSETHESGLAFWIRKDLRLKDLPVVFFGSHNQDEGERLCESDGGNAYFSKLEFNRAMILELIERLT